MENTKIYCGSAKTVGQFGILAVSLCLDELPQEYITTAKNGKRYINLKVCPKKAVDQFGKTHYVEIDTWKPNGEKKTTFNGQSNQHGLSFDDMGSESGSGVPF
jgi:hypothetical protein